MTSRLMRRKLEHIMESEDLFPGLARLQGRRQRSSRASPRTSCSRRATEDLRTTVMALLGLEEKRHVQLFVRPDLQGQRRHGDRGAAARPRLHRAAACGCRACSRSASTASRSTTTCRSARPIRPASTSWCTCPRARSRTSPSTELEREVLAAARTWDDALSDALVEKPRRAAGARAGAPLRRAVPRLLQVRRRRSAWPSSTSTSSRSLGAERPYAVALQNEQGTRRAADPAEAVQDRRQGAAVGPAAGARGARA